MITGLVAFILLYYRGFANYFVGGDDIWLYMSAPHNWERIKELFMDIGGTYRPIPFSLFSIYHVFGSNVYGMHWVPIILHSVNVILVYLLARKLSGSWYGAIVASLVYGVSHIVFFDVFTLTGLVDQVFLLFGLGSILLLLHQKVRWSWILFILAMFSKESFVSVLLVITYHLWQKRSNWKYYFAYCGPTAIYFLLKLGLYRQQGAAYSYVINLNTLGHNLFDYGLWIINWRHGWQMGMPYEPHKYYDLISLLYGGLIGMTAWRTWKTNRKLFWLSSWWGAVGLIPFYFLGRTLPFYLEFSLIGMVMIVAGGVYKKWILGSSLVVLAIYMSLTTKAQWVTNSFSARGVQAAAQFRDQVIRKYDWNQYNTLCLSGMGEYELWSTGVGQAINMLGNNVEVKINQECPGAKVLRNIYEDGQYHL